MLNKIRKGTLWESVIATVIASVVLSIGGFLLSFIYSLFTKLTIEQAIYTLWSYQIQLGYLVAFLIVFLPLTIVLIARKDSSKLEKLESTFHAKYTKIIDRENNVTYRFNAYISEYNKFPFISDLRVYCNNHENESLIDKFKGCNRIDCHVFKGGYNEEGLKKELETYLLGEWEKMKASN